MTGPSSYQRWGGMCAIRGDNSAHGERCFRLHAAILVMPHLIFHPHLLQERREFLLLLLHDGEIAKVRQPAQLQEVSHGSEMSKRLVVDRVPLVDPFSSRQLDIPQLWKLANVVEGAGGSRVVVLVDLVTDRKPTEGVGQRVSRRTTPISTQSAILHEPIEFRHSIFRQDGWVRDILSEFPAG